jgi:hypothetical protein
MEEPEIRERVTRERWSEAQLWEQSHWVNAEKARARWGKNYIWRVLSWCGLVPRHRGEDWNLWWSERFNGYRFLPETIENAIEVGCGPFTNLRIIRKQCCPQHMVLSDPLIRTYLGFPLWFCGGHAPHGGGHA